MYNVQPLRTAAEVAAARAAVVDTLATFPPGTVKELTYDLIKQLSKCKTLAEVHLVLPPTSKWQLALVDEGVPDGNDDGVYNEDNHDCGGGEEEEDVPTAIWDFFRGEPPVMWASTSSQVEPAVLEYFLEQPCMKSPWVLESISTGFGFGLGVPPEMRPCIGRGCTSLLKCVAIGGDPATVIQKCQLLLNAGACLTARDRYGKSILHCAVRTCRPDVVKWAIDTWMTVFPEPGSVDGPTDLDGVTARVRDRLENRGFAHLFPPLVV